ncbi:MAG: hypothetical protein ACLQNE_30935 [Thermoguttaceae bacterium]
MYKLIAQTTRMDDLAGGMAESFRGERGPLDLKGMMYAVVGLVILVLVAWFLTRSAEKEKHRGRCSPRRLFLSLCRTHRLGWSDRWFLWRLAAQHRLKDPARVFIEPERFDPAGTNLPLQRHATRLARLRRQLFAEILEEPQDGGGPN